MIPHRWEDCYPVLADRQTHKVDLNDEQNRQVRHIFTTELTSSERRLFHESCCLSMSTERHLAVIERIARRLEGD